MSGLPGSKVITRLQIDKTASPGIAARQSSGASLCGIQGILRPLVSGLGWGYTLVKVGSTEPMASRVSPRPGRLKPQTANWWEREPAPAGHLWEQTVKSSCARG